MILVDTNVLLDVVTDDPVWFGWSRTRLDVAALRGPLVINDIIYAELSVRYASVEAVDNDVAAAGLFLQPIPQAALFAAGKAFKRYRGAGGRRTGVPSDFFIGAHAAVLGCPLLTRDPARYRTYYPSVELMAP